ncbi:MAG: hypothetical protein A2161_08315, partial [Candidatus Schekmanbacteria bacterium RBG_13_48_7]
MKELPLLILLFCLFITSFLYGEEETRQSWTYGGIEYILPKPSSQIVIPADVPETHVVVSGDTLWGIAGQFLKDPFLWPLIWDLNMDKVPNPHLIFPGQLLVLPVIKQPPEVMPTEKIASYEPKMFPLLPRTKLIMSGYISAVIPSGPTIIGSEDPINELSTNDIIYLDIGANHGVLPGDTYVAFRSERKVVHPVTKKTFGYLILNTGLIDIIATQENTSTAIITKALTALNVGDFISKYSEEPMPLTTGSRKINRFGPPSGKLPGCILDAMGGAEGVQDAYILGYHDIVYVDLGSNNGVLPGDS